MESSQDLALCIDQILLRRQGLIPGPATWISEIWYLLIPSPDMTERLLKAM